MMKSSKIQVPKKTATVKRSLVKSKKMESAAEATAKISMKK